jgi:hypothetical protein
MTQPIEVRIREAQKEARIKGLQPKYVFITRTEYEELIDSLLNDKTIPAFTADTPIIFGMKIITNEDEILRL